MNDQNNPELTQVETLQAEIARLQALLMGKFNKETLLTELQVGSMTLQGGAAALLAEMFAHQFVEEQGGNYIELQFTSQQVLPGESFVVTIQKVSGRTPHGLRQDAEARSSELLYQLEKLSAIKVPELAAEGAPDSLTLEQVNVYSQTVGEKWGDWASGKVRSMLLAPAYQYRVHPWMQVCFGADIAADAQERNHRFLEESIELVQACGCTRSEAHQLVDYVFNRPVGEKHQEVGGVMVTLAALCLAQKLNMHQCGEVELARIWGKVDAIRAKQAAKPKHSPLPEPDQSPLALEKTPEAKGKST